MASSSPERKNFWTAIRHKAGTPSDHAFDQADRLRETFPWLPALAALAILILFAADGQLREVYLSALEEIDAKGLANRDVVVPLGFAVIGLGLLSAVLFQAQFWLTRPPPKLPLPDRANPEAGSIGERLQRTTAIALALAPWFGIVIGLVRTQFYLDGMNQLFEKMGVSNPSMADHLPRPGIWWIAASALILGAANAAFVALHLKYSLTEASKHFDQALRNVIVITTPLAAIWMLLLLVDYRLGSAGWLFKTLSWTAGFIGLSPTAALVTLSSIAALAIARGYYSVYSRLRSAPVLRLSRYGPSLLHRHRRLFMSAWLLLPWALVAPCFEVADTFLPRSAWYGTIEPGQWTAIPIAMTAAIVVALIVVQLLDYLQWTRAAALRTSTIALIVLLAVAALTFSGLAGEDTVVSLYRLIGALATTTLALIFLLSLLLLLAWLSQISRYPALGLAVIATIVIVLSPVWVFVPVAALLVICAVIATAALLAERWAIATIAGVIAAVALISGLEARSVATVRLPPPQNSTGAGKQTTTAAGSVCALFESWLKEKTWVDQKQPILALSTCPPTLESGPSSPASGTSGQVNQPQKKVFIVAVEGGGIYAASAAALFLARMEAAVPSFADHVFAISGVSGGAIGATIFAALDVAQSRTVSAATPLPAGNPAGTIAGSGQSSSGAGAIPDCGDPLSATPAQPTPLYAVCAIMEDDHYSPVVGSIFPELLGLPNGRAAALAGSLAQSVSLHNSLAEQELDGRYADYWSKAPQMPALVLNATWAETGSRVAFAPFPLHDIDQSLYSFADSKMPLIDGAVAQMPSPAPPKPGAVARAKSNCTESQPFCASLINAAVVSARFPLILPPLSLSVSDAQNHQLRWNFVDGGYADNSGAATALALYEALKGIAPIFNVDLQIILITSIDPQPDFGSVDGTAFRDTLAPVDAILDVRQAESMAAVARACNSFYSDQSQQKQCQDYAGHAADDLQIVKIEDKTYGLPLGWELSHTTFAIISWMLGRVEAGSKENPCAQYAAISQTDTSSQALRSEERNSCVLTTIAASLQGQ